MTVSKAQREADKRHHEKLDVIKIQPYKEEGSKIRDHAKRARKSVQAYVLDAIRKQMEEDDRG